MSGFVQDLRYAVRGLIKTPGFTAVAVMTLALGIGANTAMFSVLNAVLLQPLPYRLPDQLAMLWTEIPTQGLRRIFTAEEAELRQRLVVISHGFWLTRFGGSLDAIGATITLNGLPSRIIGVLPVRLPHARVAELELCAKRRLNSKQRKEVGRDSGDTDLFDPVKPRQRCGHGIENSHIREAFALQPPLFDIQVCRSALPCPERRSGLQTRGGSVDTARTPGVVH